MFQQERVVAGGKDDVFPQQTPFEQLVVLVKGDEERCQLLIVVKSGDFGEVVVMQRQQCFCVEKVGFSQIVY